MTKKKKKNPYSFLIRYVFRLTFLVAAIWAVLTYVIALHRMTGNHMYPNVKDGDLCVFYRLSDVNVNDVVLYKGNNGEALVGRIVALPGQEIDFPEEGGYLINGYIPSEQIPYQTFNSKTSKIKYPIMIEEGQLYIMNDFREDTSDSRENGTIEKSQVVGKLEFIFRRRGL